MRVVYKHPMRRSRCFVFDNLFEVAKFLHSQNQSVQLRLICRYMPHHYPPLKWNQRGNTTKIYINLELRVMIVNLFYKFNDNSWVDICI